MKLNRNTWLVAGASLLLAFTTQSAQAATVVYNPGDLVLAFRATANQGVGESLLVNVGPASTFTGAGASPINLSLGNLGADLVAQFGAGWADRTDLTWSVFGASTGASPILYASSIESTPWPVLSDPTDRLTVRGAITSVTGNFDTLDATANSTVAALQTNGSGAEHYKFQVTAGSTDFSNVSGWTNIEGTFGPGSEALNLFRVTGSAGTTGNLGQFTISSTGVVTFTGVAAVPEPSKAVFAMLGAGALFLRRRRPSIKAAV